MNHKLPGVFLAVLSLALLAFSPAVPALQAAPAYGSADLAGSSPFLLPSATRTPTPLPAKMGTPAACLPDTPLSLVYLPDSAFISEILPLPGGAFLLRGGIDNNTGTWLAKMDASGKLLWQNIYGARMGSLRLAPNGNLVLEFSRSNLEITLDGKVIRALPVPWYHPNTDGTFTTMDGAKVARYKDLQTPLWQVEAKGFAGLATTTTDGGALLAYSGVYADTSVYYAPLYTDIKVIKVLPDGQVVQRVYGKLVGDEMLEYLQATSDGGALLAGTHFYEQLGSDYDIWLMKINAGGGMSWQTTLKLAPDGETLQGIYLLDKGYLVVFSTPTSSDPYLVRLNAGGTLSWQKVITSSRGMVEVKAAAATADGGLLLAGMTWEKTSVYWMARLDSKGNLLWEKTLGFYLPAAPQGVPEGEALSLLPIAGKQILLGGYTNLAGAGLSQQSSAWIAQLPDAGQPLGLIRLTPGKVSPINTLGSRPNTLPMEVIPGTGPALKEAKYSVVETKLLSSPACLPAGGVFPTPAALPSLTPSATPTQAFTPTPAFTRNLFLANPAMQGDDVLKLQQRLYELGYTEVGARDGIFGRMTDTAVRNFQARNNLQVDGYVGPLTWKRLFSVDATRAGK